MTSGCAISATEAGRTAPAGRRRAGLRHVATAWSILTATLVAAAPTLRAADPAPAAEAAGRPVPIASPAGLRDRFDKIDKALRKAEGALGSHDPARVSFLLKRADEEIARFEAESRVADYATAVAEARAAAGRGSMPAAESALRTARAALVPLSDYTVSRSAEIAYRAALAAADAGSAEPFTAALEKMDEASLAAVVAARLVETRAAIGRARQAMVRNDGAGGAREIGAARAALGRLTYGGCLTRCRSGFLLAAELLRDSATLAARDQTQRGLRELDAAIALAPEADRDVLALAQEETRTLWRRMSRAEKEDPDRLMAASERVEALRLKQKQ